VTRTTVELDEGGDALAVGEDLAARDLGCVRKCPAEVLVADPILDDLGGLVGLLRRLEETE
jgi:hypothetical protein